jgi:hypothetical protein
MKPSLSFAYFIACLLIFLVSACQTKKSEPKTQFNAETFVPTYNLIIPRNWTTEKFAIPIDFAPSIPYTGIEDLRFAPGWDNASSEDYWTYAYLWYLSGTEKFEAKSIEQNLEAYYTGLVGRNIERRKIPQEKLFPVKAKFEMTETAEGDANTFKGTVDMLDYMAQEPIILNFLVHVTDCPGKENTYVFYEVSPQEASHPIWNTLNGIWNEFQCDVK